MSFQSNSKLIWSENLGQVLAQYFESGDMEDFQNKNEPWVEKRLGTTGLVDKKRLLLKFYPWN